MAKKIEIYTPDNWMLQASAETLAAFFYSKPATKEQVEWIRAKGEALVKKSTNEAFTDPEGRVWRYKPKKNGKKKGK